ncbi:PD-(D/E)XK nuclease family protein, partial [Paludibacteraceae bacterium OttesenSCG-928-F17]|nr:PD-(D/E)XK nuclease family protein [Paludibacteraceae bacterium OttesenSCG-928-F17]
YYHYGIELKRKTVNFNIAFNTPEGLEIKKTPDVMEKLDLFLSSGENSKALSASAINSYLDCPLQFYLTRVEGIKEMDELQETVEDSTFGTIFHAVMEYLYEPFTGRVISSEDFENLLKDSLNIDRKIHKAFAVHYFKKPEENIRLEGNNLLIARVIRKYVVQMLRTDKKYAPFTYVSSEDKRSISYPVFEGKKSVNIKGFIDRVDEKAGRIRIIDYKTGKGSLEFRSFNDVFDANKENRPKYVLQTFLYGLLYKEKAGGRQMTPSIYYVRDIFKDNFETELKYKPEKISELVLNFSDYEEEFCSRLTVCLEDIFNPDIPFRQTENTKPCEYCPYKIICNR